MCAVMDELYELFIHEVCRYEGTVNELTTHLQAGCRLLRLRRPGIAEPAGDGNEDAGLSGHWRTRRTGAH